MTGAVPGAAEDRDVSYARAVSRVRILPRERGWECRHFVAAWRERTVFDRLVDRGQHSMILERPPWLTLTCLLAGVST